MYDFLWDFHVCGLHYCVAFVYQNDSIRITGDIMVTKCFTTCLRDAVFCSSRFVRTPVEYYDWPLEQRRYVLFVCLLNMYCFAFFLVALIYELKTWWSTLMNVRKCTCGNGVHLCLRVYENTPIAYESTVVTLSKMFQNVYANAVRLLFLMLLETAASYH